MTKTRLEASSIHVRFGKKEVLKNVDFVLRAHEIVGLVGPNGAGKSSLIRSLAGLQPVNSGSVNAVGIDIQRHPEMARGLIGMVPQDVSLFDELSAEETLLLAGRLRNLQGDVLRKEVLRWLTLTELQDVGQAMSKYYSGGMRRKLALGATLIGAPPVLLLDESFAGLDPEGTHAMERELIRHAKAGAAILLCSHRLELLERIADRVVLLQDGQVSQELTHAGIERLQSEKNQTLLDWYLHAVGALKTDDSGALLGVETTTDAEDLSPEKSSEDASRSNDTQPLQT